MGKKKDYINYLSRQLDRAIEDNEKLESERDFLADQINKLESVIDQKQELMDSLATQWGI